MMTKLGMMALAGTIGTAALSSPASAHQRRDWDGDRAPVYQGYNGGYAPVYQGTYGGYYGPDRFDRHEWREHAWREHEHREHEWREHARRLPYDRF